MRGRSGTRDSVEVLSPYANVTSTVMSVDVNFSCDTDLALGCYNIRQEPDVEVALKQAQDLAKKYLRQDSKLAHRRDAAGAIAQLEVAIHRRAAARAWLTFGAVVNLLMIAAVAFVVLRGYLTNQWVFLGIVIGSGLLVLISLFTLFARLARTRQEVENASAKFRDAIFEVELNELPQRLPAVRDVVGPRYPGFTQWATLARIATAEPASLNAVLTEIWEQKLLAGLDPLWEQAREMKARQNELSRRTDMHPLAELAVRLIIPAPLGLLWHAIAMLVAGKTLARLQEEVDAARRQVKDEAARIMTDLVPQLIESDSMVVAGVDITDPVRYKAFLEGGTPSSYLPPSLLEQLGLLVLNKVRDAIGYARALTLTPPKLTELPETATPPQAIPSSDVGELVTLIVECHPDISQWLTRLLADLCDPQTRSLPPELQGGRVGFIQFPTQEMRENFSIIVFSKVDDPFTLLLSGQKVDPKVVEPFRYVTRRKCVNEEENRDSAT